MQRKNSVLTVSILFTLSFLISLPLYWQNQLNRTPPLTGGAPEVSKSGVTKVVLNDLPEQPGLPPETGPYPVPTVSSKATEVLSQPKPVFIESPTDDAEEIQSPPETGKVASISESFRSFVEGLPGGEAGVPIGVYVEDALALEIVQQPDGDNGYVPPEWGKASQFRSAERHGITGLLAHNYLSGLDFYNIQLEDVIQIVYGDGLVRNYEVKEIHGYQKLEPSNLNSDLIDLDTGQLVTTPEVFRKYYQGEHHLTLQTCLERSGLSNWGLTFIFAEPVGEFFLP